MPQPRAAHLEGKTTNRDLFKNVRGKCSGCNGCGRYIINIKERYTSVHQKKVRLTHLGCVVSFSKKRSRRAVVVITTLLRRGDHDVISAYTLAAKSL